MMSAPIPSFFKIRLVILILCFILICFLIGLLGTAFASPNIGTYNYTDTVNSLTFEVVSLFNNATDAQLACNNASGNTSTCFRSNSSVQGGTTLYSVMGWTGGWYYYSYTVPINNFKYFLYHPDYVPSNNCPDAALSLAALCGGDGDTYYYINEETCKGHCKPTGNCAEKYEQKLLQCGGTDKLKNWNNSTCTGECISCRDNALDWADENCGSASYFADYDNPTCDNDGNYIPPTIGSPCLTCSDAQERCINKCGGTGNIEVFNCNDTTPQGGYQHIESYDCSCIPPKTTCNDFRLDCEHKCGGADFIEFYSCTEGDLSTRICKCPDTPLENGSDLTNTPPEDPNADEPGTAPDPNSTDSQLLSSIEQNTRSTVQNSKIITDQLAETNQKLDWIGDNNKIIADNTAAIGDGLNNLTDAVNNLKNDDKTANILKDISNGNFNQPSDLTPYSDGKDEFDFSTRFTQFLDEMKTTAIFTLPNSISQNIPSGGNSVITIEAGQYGTHHFDFSNWGNSLLILRTVCLIAFSWVAIRIILLKR